MKLTEHVACLGGLGRCSELEVLVNEHVESDVSLAERLLNDGVWCLIGATLLAWHQDDGLGSASAEWIVAGESYGGEGIFLRVTTGGTEVADCLDEGGLAVYELAVHGVTVGFRLAVLSSEANKTELDIFDLDLFHTLEDLVGQHVKLVHSILVAFSVGNDEDYISLPGIG